MQNISSGLTMFFKLFIPTLWMAFFGMFTLVTLIAKVATIYKIGIPLFFISGCIFFYFTLMQLKRVDMDEDFMYVSNYFKTYRYTYPSISQIKERDFWAFYTIHVYLKEPGEFGKRIVFISRSKKLDRYLKAHPRVAEQLLDAIAE